MAKMKSAKSVSPVHPKSTGKTKEASNDKNPPAPSSSKRIKVGILGATGKMGKKLHYLILDQPEYRDLFQLVYAASGPNDPRFEMLAGSGAEVLIDFSSPKSSLKAAAICGQHKIPFLMCTTGFDLKQLEILKHNLKNVAWANIPNSSLGVFAFKNIVGQLASALPDSFHFEIVEVHHEHKKDAPSGTAKILAQEIQNSRKQAIVPTHSLRGGTEVGEHRVIALGQDESIELVHRASDRKVFAHGALRLAQALLKCRSKGEVSLAKLCAV
jgi:4-hydroxy-tetrahydrodipicolinate reductase